MGNGAIQFLIHISPFLLISFYTFLRYFGPLGSVDKKSDRVFDDYTENIFQSDDWRQYVDSDGSNDALDSVLANPDATNLRDVLGAITFKTNDVKSLFQTHTRVAHRLLQIPIDIAVTASAAIVVISAELLTNPGGATVTGSISTYSFTIETDVIIFVILVIYVMIGVVLWLVTNSCLGNQSPFHYRTEQRASNPPSPLEIFPIVFNRSNRSCCEWFRYYANPWLSIFYNGLAIVAILIVSLI